MAHIYYSSIARFVPGLMLMTIVLSPLAMGGLRSGTSGGILFGLALVGTLGVFYGNVIRRRLQPLLLIEGNRIVIQRGKRQEIIQDAGDYELVLNKSWLGFRRCGAQDIMIGENELSAKSWTALVAHLSTLPFSNI